MAIFKESEHPRDKDGKFTEKGKESRNARLHKALAKEKERRILKTQNKHLDKWTEPPTLVEQMQKHLGVDKAEAIEFTNALSKWADGVYYEIRKAQHEHNLSSEYYKLSQWLEKYIEKAPKWTGKPIYRGIRLTQKQIDECVVGGTFDMLGMSSWSSKELVAKKFAKKDKKPNEKEVILINKNGTNKGTSVTHLAKYKEQYEVLVSGEVSCVIKNKYSQERYTIIEVEEKNNE